MAETYLSFEVAKLLKEKGFDKQSAASYDSKGQPQEDCAYWGELPIINQEELINV